MKKIKTLRTIIELDEVRQNVVPRHFFVLRIFGIPIARFNRLERDVEVVDEEDALEKLKQTICQDLIEVLKDCEPLVSECNLSKKLRE